MDPNEQPLLPLVEKLNLLSDLTRLRLLVLLTKAETLSPPQFAEFLSIPISTIHHHLGFLTRGGLVVRLKRGKFALYQLNRQTIHQTIFQVSNLLGETNER